MIFLYLSHIGSLLNLSCTRQLNLYHAIVEQWILAFFVLECAYPSIRGCAKETLVGTTNPRLNADIFFSIRLLQWVDIHMEKGKCALTALEHLEFD